MTEMPYSEIEVRLNELQKWVIRGLGFMVTVAITGVFVAAWVVHEQNAHIEERAAKTDQAIACYIEGQYSRSVKALPSNPYYAKRPEQLADALNNIAVQRAEAQKVFGKCALNAVRRPA